MLRWGILSCAKINERFVPPALESTRSKLVSIGSRSIEKSEASAKQWNIPKFYGSYEEVINDEEVNAVYIPLPNSLHVEWTVRAADRGLHCLVEKPMALSGEGVRQIKEAMTRNNVIIEEAFVHLHHPMLYTVRDEMSGIGKITHLHGRFQSNITRESALVWKGDLGSGAIWMLGTYPVAAFIFLLNQRPISVCAQYKQHECGIDETLSAIIKFPGDVIATVTTSVTSFSSTVLEIIGSDGIIKLDHQRCFHVGQIDGNNQFDVITSAGKKTVSTSTEEAFAAQLRRFEETILDKKNAAVSLEVSEWIADTLAACVKSSKEEKFVHL